MSDIGAVVRSNIRAGARSLKSLAKQVHLDLGGDQHSAVFLSGNGRGGTTWLAECINYDNSYRFIFEPFNAAHVPLCRAFGNRQYLRPGDTRPEYLDPARAIVTGHFRNGWADYYNRRLVSRGRLIKDIRANLCLRWLYELFPGMPIVLVLRHPCAVASSRLRYAWGHDLNEFFNQPDLVEDFLKPIQERLLELRDPFELHVARWCIENYIPLRQFASGEIHVIFYESFRAHPRQEIERLFAFIGRPLDDSVFERLGRPSSMAWESAGGILLDGARTDGWKRSVSDAQTHRALEILQWFGLDRLYSADALPLVDAHDVLRHIEKAAESKGPTGAVE